MFVYDITNLDSFLKLDSWVDEIKESVYNNFQNISMILIGSKCDLECDRKVSIEQGKKFASKYGMKFLEVSAKESINIEKAFNNMTKEVLINLNKKSF